MSNWTDEDRIALLHDIDRGERTVDEAVELLLHGEPPAREASE